MVARFPIHSSLQGKIYELLPFFFVVKDNFQITINSVGPKNWALVQKAVVGVEVKLGFVR